MRTTAKPFLSKYSIDDLSSIKHDILLKLLKSEHKRVTNSIKDGNRHLEQSQSELSLLEDGALKDMQQHYINQQYMVINHCMIKANELDEMIASLENPNSESC